MRPKMIFSEHPRKEKEKKKEKKKKKEKEKKKRSKKREKRKKENKEKRKKTGAETTNHLRMYTLAQRTMESCPRMCGFLRCRVPLLDVTLSHWMRERLLSTPGEGQTFSECGLFPRENGRATCEGTARDLILRKRVNYLKNCNEEREETRWKGRENREKRRWKTRSRENEEREMKRDERKDFVEKCLRISIFARWISPKCFEKIPFGRIIPLFFSKVQSFTVFSVLYMIRIRLFGPEN